MSAVPWGDQSPQQGHRHSPGVWGNGWTEWPGSWRPAQGSCAPWGRGWGPRESPEGQPGLLIRAWTLQAPITCSTRNAPEAIAGWAGHSCHCPLEVLPCLMPVGPVSGYSGGQRALPSNFSLSCPGTGYRGWGVCVFVYSLEIVRCVCVQPGDCVCARTQPGDTAYLPLPHGHHGTLSLLSRYRLKQAVFPGAGQWVGSRPWSGLAGWEVEGVGQRALM